MSRDTGALEIAAWERVGEPIPSVRHDYLKAFPSGCCKLARYLMEHNDRLFPYDIGMDWRINAQDYGHVIVA